eukprot:scaffold10687_cov53-Phaeocystis_antarctica.AAC.2
MAFELLASALRTGAARLEAEQLACLVAFRRESASRSASACTSRTPSRSRASVRCSKSVC